MISGSMNGQRRVARRIGGQLRHLRDADKNLRYQQNLAGRTLAVVELPSNRLPVLATMAAAILSAVAGTSPGSFKQIQLRVRGGTSVSTGAAQPTPLAGLPR